MLAKVISADDLASAKIFKPVVGAAAVRFVY